MKINDLIVIDSLAGRTYRKCGLCGRIRNLVYRLTVKDAKTGKMVVGSLLLCADCGNNLGDIVGVDLPHDRPAEKVVHF